MPAPYRGSDGPERWVIPACGIGSPPAGRAPDHTLVPSHHHTTGIHELARPGQDHPVAPTADLARAPDPKRRHPAGQAPRRLGRTDAEQPVPSITPSHLSVITPSHRPQALAWRRHAVHRARLDQRGAQEAARLDHQPARARFTRSSAGAIEPSHATGPGRENAHGTGPGQVSHHHTRVSSHYPTTATSQPGSQAPCGRRPLPRRRPSRRHGHGRPRASAALHGPSARPPRGLAGPGGHHSKARKPRANDRADETRSSTFGGLAYLLATTPQPRGTAPLPRPIWHRRAIRAKERGSDTPSAWAWASQGTSAPRERSSPARHHTIE
jgi:hypothetical protein